MTQMTLAAANSFLTSAVAKARLADERVSVSVVDARGDLVAFVRLDGAEFYTADLAIGKAIVAATFGEASGAWEARGESLLAQAVNETQRGRMVFVQGAMPIRLGDGVLIGAIGVSGAASAVDEEIAAAGAAVA